MDRILLKITGMQFVDGQQDQIELTTVGTMRDDGAAYIIRYTEEQEPPMAPVKVAVRIQKDESAVQITRSGGFESCLIIEKAKRNQCNYDTGCGNLLMGIYGRMIETNVEAQSGNFIFGYDIDINGAVTSKNTVQMEYSIKEKEN
ncbi:MAG: DUF1934 domain-containing protein [Eubacterium sp.]|nr:DUF1934 domain-containing protein [Eubacterium sp.]